MTTDKFPEVPHRFRDLYALGLNLIPLEPRAKKPVIPWQEYQLRRATATEIAAWSSNPRGYNVGVVCGPTSGNLVVLDIDSNEARAELECAHGPLPRTPVVKTAKGWHFYLTDPTGELRNFVGKLPGVDLRATGGYVVGPGSIHPSGVEYRWLPGLSPVDVGYAVTPGWLDERARTPKRGRGPSGLESVGSILPRALSGWMNPRVARYAQKALENAIFELDHAAPGSRNHTLNVMAFGLGQLVGGGALDEDTVERALYEAADRNGLLQDDGERAVIATMRSGLSAGMEQPRDLSHLAGGRERR